jgi:hypothetical protein
MTLGRVVSKIVLAFILTSAEVIWLAARTDNLFYHKIDGAAQNKTKRFFRRGAAGSFPRQGRIRPVKKIFRRAEKGLIKQRNKTIYK